jgi:hypothetical protein
MAKFKRARNYYTDQSTGYEINRFICQNAPTNIVRPRSNLDGHGYESYGVGNGPGYSWLNHLRTRNCPKCGGTMIPIDQWQPDHQQKMYHILYPEDRTVAENRIRTWAADAISNGEIEGPWNLDTDTLAKQLDDAGLITLGRS